MRAPPFRAANRQSRRAPRLIVRGDASHPDDPLTPNGAGKLADGARAIFTSRRIVPSVERVYDRLLWGARERGKWACSWSLKRIAAGTGLCKSTVNKAIQTLCALGLIVKQKRWVLVEGGPNGASAAPRQATSIYTFRRLNLGSEIQTANQVLSNYPSSLPCLPKLIGTENAAPPPLSADMAAALASLGATLRRKGPE